MSHSSKLRDIAERLLLLAAEADCEIGGALPSTSSAAELGLIEGGVQAQPPAAFLDPVVLQRHAEALLKARRVRETGFPAELFADPAWDMLLDLFVQRCRGRRVSVTSLCIASQVAPTTALRWIKLLEEHRLVQREVDATDARRNFISLSPRCEVAMTRVLIEMGRHLRLTPATPLMLPERQTR